MITLTIEDKKYSMPNSWKEINVGLYEQIFKINKEGLNQIEYFVKIFCILTGIEEDIAYDMDTNSFKEISDNLKFVSEPIKDKMKTSIIVQNGDVEEEYFLKKDFNKLTLGESISVEAIMQKYDNKLEQGISEILCIFLRKKINGELEPFKNKFMERQELFKSISVSDVYQMFIFFSSGKAI